MIRNHTTLPQVRACCESTTSLRYRPTPKKACLKDNIPEVLDNGEVTDGTHVTAGQLALALTPYAQVTDLAVNTATTPLPLDDRVTAELASKLDSSALAPAIAPLATAAALAPRTVRWPRTEAASQRCRAR